MIRVRLCFFFPVPLPFRSLSFPFSWLFLCSSLSFSFLFPVLFPFLFPFLFRFLFGSFSFRFPFLFLSLSFSFPCPFPFLLLSLSLSFSLSFSFLFLPLLFNSFSFSLSSLMWILWSRCEASSWKNDEEKNDNVWKKQFERAQGFYKPPTWRISGPLVLALWSSNTAKTTMFDKFPKNGPCSAMSDCQKVIST